MAINKNIKDLNIAILVPCYKRPEYTRKCINSLENCDIPCNVTFFLVDDGSMDETSDIINNAKLYRSIKINSENAGLRDVIIDFFEAINRDGTYDFIAKIDNDCIVPKDWIIKIIEVFSKTDVDILSPNVIPSNAAFTYGKDGEHYRPAEIVGGLWFMKSSLIKDIFFERHPVVGLHGAISLLKQIATEKEPKIGWVADVIVEDVGHWSGQHKSHIKSRAHEIYSLEIGRQIAWRSTT